MFIDEDNVLWITDDGKKLLFAPESYSLKLLMACHDSEIGGHRDQQQEAKEDPTTILVDWDDQGLQGSRSRLRNLSEGK